MRAPPYLVLYSNECVLMIFNPYAIRGDLACQIEASLKYVLFAISSEEREVILEKRR